MLARILTTLVRSHLDTSERGGVAPRAEVIAHLRRELADSFLGDVPPAVVGDNLGRLAAAGPVIAVGDRIVDLTVAAAGVPFTHRLTEVEIVNGTVDLDADLAVIARIATADGGLHRRDGVPITQFTSREDHAGPAGLLRRTRKLHGPDGWLDGFEPGQLVTFTTEGGYLDIAAAGAADPGPAVADRVQAALDEANEGDGSPVDVEDLQASGLVDGWHRPTATSPPFGEVLAAAGLERDGALVGRPGCWERHAELDRTLRVHAQHGPHLEDRALRSLEAFLGAFAAWRRDPSTPLERRLLTDLFEQPEAVFCLEEELAREDPSGADLTRFVDAVPAPTSHHLAVPEGLRVLAAMLRGDADAVVEHLARTFEHDHSWPPALEHAATAAEACGDAQGAAGLFQRTRDGKDDQLARLRQIARAGLATAGRNDPCPCGSGRKFKQCHQGRDLLPTDVRAAWLLDRASTHVRQFRPDVVRDLEIEATATPTADVDEVKAVVDDIALFDRGGLRDYVTSWRPLLSEADVDLAEAWLSASHSSVFAVVELDPARVVLVDRSPEAAAGTATFEVVDPAGFADVNLDDLVWCRLLPDAATPNEPSDAASVWRTSGVVRPLLPDEVDVMLAADRDDELVRLRALLGGDHGLVDPAPDGHPRFWATTSWQVGTDRAAVEATLDGEFGRFESTWIFPPDARVDPELVATLLDPFDSAFGLDADARVADLVGTLGFDPAQVRLVSHAESLPAHEASKARYRALFPDAELGDEDAIPIARRRALEQEDLVQDAFWSATRDDDHP